MHKEDKWYHGHHPHPHHHPRIEAITVCVGYGDFLEETAKRNMGLFDKWLIITSPSDKVTREICRRYSLETLLTDDHGRTGDFNKGRIIDRGISHLSNDSWRVHVDGDIILPLNFRNIIKSSHLDTAKIYGCDRIMVKSRADWHKLQISGWVANDFHCRINFPKGFSLGSRWADVRDGYCPIGFFQMWHSSQDLYNGARVKTYSSNHNSACRTDVQFSQQWDRKDRVLIPELIAVHLESEPAALGANWNGRTTKKF